MIRLIIVISDTLGPLTITWDGTTTVYGVVSGDGILGEKPDKYNIQKSLYGNIANADVLKWIKNSINKYE